VLFAIALLPLMMIVGLTIDYGFYSEAQTQLDMAADSSAINAARIAAAGWQVSPGSNYIQQGAAAGKQWFYAQLGSVPQAKVVNPPRVDVSYNANLRQVTAKVSYDGIIGTHFGGIFPVHWTYWPNLGVSGSATAVISIASYVEVMMLLDNSSSMLIAADEKSTRAMQELTPCSAQGAQEGQPFDYNYSWAYLQTGGGWITNPPASAYSNSVAPNSNNIHIPWGYGIFLYPDVNGVVQKATDITPPAGTVGRCDQNFTGLANECRYPTAFLSKSVSTAGTCVNGLGGPGSVMVYPNTTIPQGIKPPGNMPQAPCAFACHNQPTGANGYSNDYYGLALQNKATVTLRYQVMQDAAADVISAMQNSTSGSQLSVGVYQFNAPGTSNETSGFLKVYPTTAAEASNDWATAESLTQNVAPPQTDDLPDTNFENAMTLLGNSVTAAGSGATAAGPLKNLFIVTDGMDDYYLPGTTTRVQGPITPAACNYFKAPVAQGGLGYTVYVLYTKYFPLPNPYYLQNDKMSAESVGGGPSPIEAAMQACASTPKDFYEADNSNGIYTSLKKMLAAALGTAGRLSD